MNSDTLGQEDFEQNLPSDEEEEENDIVLEEENNNLKKNKSSQKFLKRKVDKTDKIDKLELKYPLKKIIDFSSSNKSKIWKIFNLVAKEIIHKDFFFNKNMFLSNSKIEINKLINNLIEFKLGSVEETINKKGFYKDKIKPMIILYSSNCYDLIKYEKQLKAESTSMYNLVVLNFFGKHKKIKEEITKIKDKFNKSKSTSYTFYVILTTPNRILKLSNEKLLDFSFLQYNILDLTPNVKNLTFLDMKDCRVDFFNFMNVNLKTMSDFEKTKYIVYLDK